MRSGGISADSTGKFPVSVSPCESCGHGRSRRACRSSRLALAALSTPAVKEGLSSALRSLAVPIWCALLLLPVLPVLAGEEPWTAPAAEREKPNPVPRAVGVPVGKQIFDTNCNLCHGKTGKGDGPVGAALTPKPKDLTSQTIQAQTDGTLFWKISTGRGAMPSWQTLPETDRWSVVDFLRSLGEK